LNCGLGEFRLSHPMWRSGAAFQPNPNAGPPFFFSTHLLPTSHPTSRALHYDVFEPANGKQKRKIPLSHIIKHPRHHERKERRGRFPDPACGRGSMAHTHTHTNTAHLPASRRPVHLTDLILKPVCFYTNPSELRHLERRPCRHGSGSSSSSR
jgi:hypothetical protein